MVETPLPHDGALRPRLALYQPDIPQNTGTLLRLGACLDVAIDIIEPAGFDVSDRNLKRAGLDYLPFVSVMRHLSFAHFDAWRTKAGYRLVLATTHGATPYTEHLFCPKDIILLGRESAGVPPEIHALAAARIFIPLRSGMRSLNVAVSGAIIMAEALRQCALFPIAQLEHVS
jgi:tRNA (cytidine/uridine-2'-O-)-methyltransferase